MSIPGRNQNQTVAAAALLPRPHPLGLLAISVLEASPEGAEVWQPGTAAG